MSYLVDSDWLIDAFLGIPTAVNLLARLRDEGLAVSIISYGELFEGAIGAPDPATELARFRRFLARLTVLPLDDATMERFARIRAALRRRGQLIPDNYKACRALRNYLQVRPKIDEGALFLTKFGLPIGPRSIENVVAKYAAAAGITDASPHALRHTFATQHVKKGTSLASVRAALGHENLATTSLYVGLAREQMDKELQQNAL